MPKIPIILFSIAFLLVTIALPANAQADETIPAYICVGYMATIVEDINGQKIEAQKAIIASHLNRKFDFYHYGGTYEIEQIKSERKTIEGFATKYPLLAKTYGTYLTSDRRVRAAGTARANTILDSLEGTLFSKPFRWADWFPIDDTDPEAQIFPEEEFLKQILKKKILRATNFGMFEHDRFDDHSLAILLMPPEIFEAYRARVKLLFEIREIFKDNRWADYYLNKLISTLTDHWDSNTGEAGTTIRVTAVEADIPSIAQDYLRIVEESFFDGHHLVNTSQDQIQDILGYLKMNNIIPNKHETLAVESLIKNTPMTSLPSKTAVEKYIKDLLAKH